MPRRRGHLIVKVGVDHAGVDRDLDILGRKFRNFFMMIGGVYGFGRLIKRGIEFNKTLETAQVGIAAILRQFRPRHFSSTADALGVAGDMMAEIKEQAMLTVDTIRDLTMGYKNLAGVMFQANVPVNKQVRLLVLMSQAVRGMGLGARGQQMFQLIEETRALLTGQVTRYSVVAQQLVAKAPGGIDALRAAIREGRAFEFIRQHLLGFEEAGDLLNKTLEGSISNLNDIIDAVLGFATSGLMEQLKTWIIDLQNYLKDPSVQQGLKNFIDALTTAAKVGVEKGGGAMGWLRENKGAIGETALWGAGILGARRFLKMLMGLLRFFKNLGAWWLSGAAKILRGAWSVGSKVAANPIARTVGRGVFSRAGGLVGTTVGLGLKAQSDLGAWGGAEESMSRWIEMDAELLRKRRERAHAQATHAAGNRLLESAFRQGKLTDLDLLGTGKAGFQEAAHQHDIARQKANDLRTAMAALLPSFRSVLTDEEKMISLRAQKTALEKEGISAHNVAEWFQNEAAIVKMRQTSTKSLFANVFSRLGRGDIGPAKYGLFSSRAQAMGRKTPLYYLKVSAQLLEQIRDKMATPDPYAPS